MLGQEQLITNKETLRVVTNVVAIYKQEIEVDISMSSGSSPEVQNVVSLAKLNAEDLDLQTIAQKSENSRYNPKRFPAVITRKILPKSTVDLGGLRSSSLSQGS